MTMWFYNPTVVNVACVRKRKSLDSGYMQLRHTTRSLGAWPQNLDV